MTEDATIEAAQGPDPGHGPSIATYLVIFTLLMILLVATVAVARVDLGWANLPVAMAIAITKAMLVILFFMHVKYSGALIWLVASSGFVGLAILLGYTLSDYGSREWLASPEQTTLEKLDETAPVPGVNESPRAE